MAENDATPGCSAADPQVSVIICTRNRARQLERSLEHVERISYEGSWELIVVDNGSTDDTAQVVKAFAERSPVHVRSVRAPLPGLARARNAGVAHARGRIVCFTDDDCYPAPDLLQEVERAFAHPEVSFIGGRVLLYDPLDARITIKEDETARAFGPGDVIHAGVLHGANIAVRRGVFERVGGFDPLLGAGAPLISGEDTDFLARLSAAGFSGRYHPGAVVYHHHGRRDPQDIRSLRRGYAIGRGAVYMKALFRRRTTAPYARLWIRSFRAGVRWRIMRELQGAGLYCLYATRQWAQRVTGVRRDPAVR